MNDMRQGGPRIRSPPPPPPPSEKMRVHRSEYVDPYLPHAGGDAHAHAPIRKKIPSRRSLTPPEHDRSRRILIGDRRGKSIERGVSVRDGRDTFGHKWSQFDEGYQPREGYIRREAPHKYIIQESKEDAKHLVGASDDNFHLPASSNVTGQRISHQKSVYLDDGHGHQRSFYRRLPPDIGPPGKSTRNFPSSTPSGNIDVDVRDEELRYLDNLHRGKVTVRGLYKQDKDLIYTRDVPDSMRVLSRSKASTGTSSGVLEDEYLVSRQDNLVLHSQEFVRKQRKYVGPIEQEGYGQASRPDFARDPDMDLTYYHQEAPSPTRAEHHDYRYSGYERREIGDPDYLPDGKMRPSVQGDYTNRDSTRPSFSTSVIGRSDYIEGLRKNRENVVRNNHSLAGEPDIDYLENKRSSLPSERDREFLGSGSTNFRTKVTRDYEITHPEDDYGFEGEVGLLPYKGRMGRSQVNECDSDICRLDYSPKRRSREEELSIIDPSERMLKRKYAIDEDTSRHNSRIILSGRNTSRRIQEFSDNEEPWIDEDPGEISISKRLRFGHPQHRKVGRPYDRSIASRLSAPNDWITSEDLPLHVRRRAIGGFTRADGIKGRLRPCPTNYHDSYPFERKNYFYKSNKYWKRNVDSQQGGLPTEDGDPLDDSVTTVKPEPPEDSEEFKQLVDNSFLLYSKHLNENPAQRRRYKEQGYAGSLFCSVCGSLSKEFMDTRSLVTHTFMSRKVGIRSDHLGLHKALCVLMGWNSTVAPNGACLYQVLPEAEAFAKKEDLILWPPLVIIHNSSIRNNISDEQRVISIEQMEAVLIDLGFSGGMFKVRRGKPANQSIMVVKFLPTFSGLQEAERLHNYFIEDKRGRKEFKQLLFSNLNGSEEAEGTHADKVELVLYGYLGIAEDLDKVDFETKKRSVVKSKKDIQAIADAPLKTN